MRRPRISSQTLRSEVLRYGAATKRRLLRTTRKVSAGDGCAVCGAPRSAYESITFEPDPKFVRSFSRCTDGCGFVQIEELPGERYRSKKSLDELPSGGGQRIGTEDRPGREFYMARMAIDILGTTDVEVMVYGIGRSLDNHHIQAMHRVRNVAIGDIMKLRDDAEFHDANQPATKTFPVVVASEVVEHFRRPHEDFAKLFQFVAKDGLLVCGTNIYSGGDLAKDRYPFYPDHTSYYTPEALLEIAKANGYYLDFRTPKRAGERGRKRYVLFTRSPLVMRRVALHFGRVAHAPSE